MRPVSLQAPLDLPIDSAAVSAHPIWPLLLERARTGSRPGQRADRARIALAIEGGGMAGSVTAGMCATIEMLGLLPAFDVVYGASAGALNASYAVSGQVRTRVGLYPRAAEARLFSPRRALRGLPPFRLGDLITVLLSAHPHDPEVLRASPELRITAARVEDKRLDVLSEFTSVEELRTGLWASCAIPILAGDVVEVRGTQYVDGGLIESVPYATALRGGATHVLALRSRHAGYRCRAYPPPAMKAFRRLLRDAPSTVLEMIRDRPARYNDDVAALQPPTPTALTERVCQITPPATAPVVSQFEARPVRLTEAVRLGARSALEAIAPNLGPASAMPPAALKGSAA
jgi:predicted patatin/cPLA2 family phospholipase